MMTSQQGYASVNIFKRFFSSFVGKKIKIPFLNFLPVRSYDFSTFGRERKYLEEYKGWVYACVTAIAREVATMRLRLFRISKKGEEEEIHEHELLNLLDKVNPVMTFYSLIEITETFLRLEGNAFWFLARDNQNKIMEIWPIRPDKIQIAINKENPLLIGGYVYRGSKGEKITFSPEEVIHFKKANPLGDYPFPVRGIGTVQAATLAIDTDNFAREWNRKFFQNSARPDGVLTFDGAIEREEYDRIRAEWEAEHQGPDMAHKTAILHSGLKYEPINFTQKEMDFIEQRRFSRDEILALFGVPKSILGITEDVNRANAETAIFTFTRNTVEPAMKLIIDTLNEFLIPLFRDDVFLDFDNPIPDDRAQTISEYAQGHNKWLTTNDIRRAEGLSPIKNGDSILAPLGLIPIGRPEEIKQADAHIKKYHRRSPKRKPRRKKEESKTVSEITKKKLDELLAIKKEDQPQTKIRLPMFPAIVQFQELYLKQFDDREKRLIGALNTFFRKQEKRAIEALEEEIKGLKIAEYQLKRFELLDEDEELEASINLITPFLRRFLTDQAEQAGLLIGVDVAVNLNRLEIQQFFKDRADLFGEEVTSTTIQSIQEQVRTGISEGEGIPVITQRIRDVYDPLTQEDGFRAVRIARTETLSASNFGNVVGLEEAGVEKHQWLATLDGRERESHRLQHISNQIVEIGQKFKETDIRWPGDVEGPPEETINCRCITIPVIEE